MHPETRLVDGLPLLLWHPEVPLRSISCGPLGGGIGLRGWVVNATVNANYARRDPAAHLGEIAGQLGLRGPGIGLLTAVDVRNAVTAEQDGVTVTATTGVGHPTWAADDADSAQSYSAGTINIVVHVPVALTDSALVNLVGAATEAKTQAMLTYGIAGTGTATDTVTVLCPTEGPPESFGGVRSRFGARAAISVFDAVHAGLAEDRVRTAVRYPRQP